MVQVYGNSTEVTGQEQILFRGKSISG